MSDYTESPWKAHRDNISGYNISDSKGDHIAHVYAAGEYKRMPAKANAALIEAAPTLLEAVEWALAALRVEVDVAAMPSNIRLSHVVDKLEHAAKAARGGR